MKVMQLIDSLHIGGAERMAVTYANMLSTEIEESYLCVTRSEGSLKNSIDTSVKYIFIERTKTIDTGALSRLLSFIKKERITHVHAHGTSYFFATLIKIRYPRFQLIWHNHHGASAKMSFFKKKALQWCSRYFDAVLVVNKDLEVWARENTYAKNIKYIPNFVRFRESASLIKENLPGEVGYRVISLANLRHPKEHLFLCKAFEKVVEKVPQATLHLVGTDFENTYSDAIKSYVYTNSLAENIFIHGSQSTPEQFLNACDIGVIASSSEGLPMALLEYGAAGLAPVSTNVGECAAVVGNNGIIVPSGDSKAMKNALLKLLNNVEERVAMASLYKDHIRTLYSEECVQTTILNIYTATDG